MSALVVAVQAERIHQVKLLLANPGVDINYRDTKGQTALFKTCFMRKKWKSILVANLLIQNRININAVDRSHRTCLSYACMVGKEYLVKIFLETGDMAPNTRDENGFTNLMHAVQSANISVVSMLLLFLNKYGLSLDERTTNGFTAYMLALKDGHVAIADLLREKGASTQTFDFENFRSSEDWRKFSAGDHRRASTAPGVLTQHIETLEWAKCSPHLQTLFMLREHSKQEPLEFYHTTQIRSTGLSEAKTILRGSQTAKERSSTQKLPNINKGEPTARNVSQHQRNSINSAPPNLSHHRSQFCTKNILGMLLNESVLTKTQIEEDQERLERAKNAKIVRKVRKDTLLPNIDISGPTDDPLNIRRCYSTDPTNIRKRSLSSAHSYTSRRISMIS
ncbi:homeobox protein Wariai-like [Clytia hemisphaerica]|uniref:Uncharacterized protein n=1 Tax=Clytia hemisphaerica TaxID=252671 RepID=A0A7M5V624_9CNID